MQDTWIYFAHPGDLDHCKIGITRDLDKRMSQLRCGLYFALRMARDEARQMERTLHQAFASTRLRQSEWFLVDGRLAGYLNSTIAALRPSENVRLG